jgi:hypothetical protein
MGRTTGYRLKWYREKSRRFRDRMCPMVEKPFNPQLTKTDSNKNTLLKLTHKNPKQQTSPTPCNKTNFLTISLIIILVFVLLLSCLCLHFKKKRK